MTCGDIYPSLYEAHQYSGLTKQLPHKTVAHRDLLHYIVIDTGATPAAPFG